MKVFIEPARKDWRFIIERPAFSMTALQDGVKNILDDVKANGDKAVQKYTRQFDKVDIDVLEVTREEIGEAARAISPSLKKAIETAADNIRRFHASQIQPSAVVETMPGVRCWRRSVAIEKVGLYIPGGTAPLFSTVLMLGIPAMLAGCREIILCTPPSAGKEKEATIAAEILFAAQLVGIPRLFNAGGVQAIAAMAYGTESIPAVYKIFGPGNQYVNCAKQLVQADGLSIDMPAGPSELCVLADDSCKPSYVAADLLSQAEHGADSQVMLVCSQAGIAEQVTDELQRQLEQLPRRDIISQSLQNSRVVILHDMKNAIDLVNEYAPEHLIIACRNEEDIAERIVNAGSVFLGNYSPESAGDYASGTNHTLPTHGFARSYSGVSVDSFVRKITYQQISKKGLELIGNTVEQMAAAEGLDAHRNSITIRLKKLL